jgi:hypothetical protein
LTLSTGLGSYGFLRNSSLNDYDARGLCGGGGTTGGEVNTCGPDVTAALKATLKDISKTFWLAGKQKQMAAGDAMYDIGGIFMPGGNGGAETAWDINDLYNAGGQVDYKWETDCGIMKSSGSCKLSVTFKGNCYYATAVNYTMWGRMNWLEYAANILYGNKVNNKHDFNSPASWAWFNKRLVQRVGALQTSQVEAFVRYGYAGKFVPPTPLPGCGGSSCTLKDPVFQWRWRGINFEGQVPQ